MKIAVVYTGALRTIRKTIGYLKQNVLLSGDVHIFACLQNDSTTSSAEMETWIRQELSPHLRSFEWFDLDNYSEWIMLREKNLDVSHVSNRWKDYLRSSGSMIEYLQLYLAYKQLFSNEQTNGFDYDYIIRIRPDNMFAKPIDFHWLSWNEQNIQQRLDFLHQQMELAGIPINHESTLRYFMNTMLDDHLVLNLKNMMGEFIPNSRVTIPTNAKELLHYLHHGAYILTFRANNLYIVRRDLFHLIPSLFGMYGLLRGSSDEYWFNAENQFQYACRFSGLAIHDYNTLFEDRSLYEYDESRYFDAKYRVINPMMVYCLVRR